MWDLPGPGLQPVSPALAGGFLTTAPPGKSCSSFLKVESQREAALSKGVCTLQFSRYQHSTFPEGSYNFFLVSEDILFSVQNDVQHHSYSFIHLLGLCVKSLFPHAFGQIWSWDQSRRGEFAPRDSPVTGLWGFLCSLLRQMWLTLTIYGTHFQQV